MTGSYVLSVVWRLFILSLQPAHELTLTVSCQERGILRLVDPKSSATFVYTPKPEKQAHAEEEGR